VEFPTCGIRLVFRKIQSLDLGFLDRECSNYT
jgi:hypothetical protein